MTALLAHAGQGPFQPNASPWLFLPFVANLYLTCPTTSSQTYDVIGIQGGYYKSNALTDENADFRLSILGYAPTTAPMTLVNYSGPADPHAPQMAGIFEPNRALTSQAFSSAMTGIGTRAGRRPTARGGVNND